MTLRAVSSLLLRFVVPSHLNHEWTRMDTNEATMPPLGFGKSSMGLLKSFVGFGKTHVGFCTTHVGFGQTHGRFGQTHGRFGQTHGRFGQTHVGFRKSHGRFCTTHGGFGKSHGGLGKNQRRFSQFYACLSGWLARSEVILWRAGSFLGRNEGGRRAGSPVLRHLCAEARHYGATPASWTSEWQKLLAKRGLRAFNEQDEA